MLLWQPAILCYQCLMLSLIDLSLWPALSFSPTTLRLVLKWICRLTMAFIVVCLFRCVLNVIIILKVNHDLVDNVFMTILISVILYNSVGVHLIVF